MTNTHFNEKGDDMNNTGAETLRLALAALHAFRDGFKDGSIRFTKKREADTDPYHPANTLLCAALAEADHL